jgi:dolichyl-phosphate-mannose--protein O-mannosyl transferase
MFCLNILVFLICFIHIMGYIIITKVNYQDIGNYIYSIIIFLIKILIYAYSHKLHYLFACSDEGFSLCQFLNTVNHL